MPTTTSALSTSSLRRICSLATSSPGEPGVGLMMATYRPTNALKDEWHAPGKLEVFRLPSGKA